MYIKTSCNAACNLSSGEKIAEQGADRVREQSHDQRLEQERLAIERQRVETVTAVEQPQKISDQTINHRVNEYQSQDNSLFNTSAPNNIGTLINTKV